jgi:putative flippase GtrA
MSLIQYARFLAIGGVVGAITVGCRELIGFLLGADEPFRYSVSVLTAYAIGIVLSFLINRRHTFRDIGRSPKWASFLRFVLVAILGLFLTWLLALTIRYETSWLIAPGKYSASAAFVLAALISTAITYPLNALLVFRSFRRTNEPLPTDVAGPGGA